MAITFPHAMPSTPKQRRNQWRYVDVSAGSRSPFTGSTEEQAGEGQWFEVDITLPPMYDSQGAAWQAWFAAMQGRVGTFLFGDGRRRTPLGIGGGAPLVFGGGQEGAVLEIDGAPISTAGWLLAGTHFQLGSGATSRLHYLTADANTDGAGRASLDIWPRLRSSPADNDPLTLIDPKGVFRLASAVRRYETNESGIFPEFSFVAIEKV